MNFKEGWTLKCPLFHSRVERIDGLPRGFYVLQDPDTDVTFRVLVCRQPRDLPKRPSDFELRGEKLRFLEFEIAGGEEDNQVLVAAVGMPPHGACAHLKRVG